MKGKDAPYTQKGPEQPRWLPQPMVLFPHPKKVTSWVSSSSGHRFCGRQPSVPAGLLLHANHADRRSALFTHQTLRFPHSSHCPGTFLGQILPLGHPGLGQQGPLVPRLHLAAGAAAAAPSAQPTSLQAPVSLTPSASCWLLPSGLCAGSCCNPPSGSCDTPRPLARKDQDFPLQQTTGPPLSAAPHFSAYSCQFHGNVSLALSTHQETDQVV